LYSKNKRPVKIEIKRLLYALFFPSLLVVLLWLILLLENGLGADWHHWGIYPRTLEGLWGILTEPLIHSGVSHLFSNTVPLLVLGWCLFYFYREMGFALLPAIWVLSGFLTWCVGRDSWHIGASGVVYGLSFFLFFSGIFRKYIPLMAVSLLVAFLYGSGMWSMFPIAEAVDPSISWEGHLAGAASGFICALIFRNYGPQKPQEPENEEEDDEDNAPPNPFQLPKRPESLPDDCDPLPHLPLGDDERRREADDMLMRRLRKQPHLFHFEAYIPGRHPVCGANRYGIQ
jgi:membrane associated rhomboid family serine protease